jgi:threonine/homoserine/homoserine lactone efflux protein
MLNPLPCATYAFVMSITPGPNNVMLTAAGANFGLRRTVPHILGVTAGFALLVSAACGGLAVVFTRFPPVQFVLKWAGGGYLLFLGWQILRSRSAAGGGAAQPITFREAAAFQFLNPKAWIIALTGATLFLPPGERQVFAIAYVTAIVTLVNLPCITVWAVFGSTLGLVLTRPAARRAFNWAMAVALGATGIMMVT